VGDDDQLRAVARTQFHHRVADVGAGGGRARAKWAAQPRTPYTPMAVAIACRICRALGSSECCSGDANSAPVRAALMLRS